MALPKRLQAVLDQLEAADARFQQRARSHILKLYRELDFKSLQRLLNDVLAQPKGRRQKSLGQLLQAFDEATQTLKVPPKLIYKLLAQAAKDRVLTTDQILTIMDSKFKFNRDRGFQRDYARGAQQEFSKYWEKESKRFRRDIQGVLKNATRLGWSPERAAREVQRRTGVSRARAELIATDQIQKARAYADQQRQEALGIKRYLWITVVDNRVRREHQLRHKRVFEWAKPPPDGHPGYPIRCRCRSIPYLGASRLEE